MSVLDFCSICTKRSRIPIRKEQVATLGSLTSLIATINGSTLYPKTELKNSSAEHELTGLYIRFSQTVAVTKKCDVTNCIQIRPNRPNTVNVDSFALYIFSHHLCLSNIRENIYIVKITFIMPHRSSNINNTKINLREFADFWISAKINTRKYIYIHSILLIGRGCDHTQIGHHSYEV